MLQKNLNTILIAQIHFIYFISESDGFTEEKNGCKYLNIALTDSNNDVLIKYAKVERNQRSN